MMPIQTFQVPVEVYIVLLQNENDSFCASQIRDILNEKLNLGLYNQRVNQILKGLYSTGRLKREQKPRGHGSNALTYFYQVNVEIEGLNGNKVAKVKVIERILNVLE